MGNGSVVRRGFIPGRRSAVMMTLILIWGGVSLSGAGESIQVRYDHPFIWLTAVQADAETLIDEIARQSGRPVRFGNTSDTRPVPKISVSIDKMTLDRAIANICRILGLSYAVLFDDRQAETFVLFYPGTDTRTLGRPVENVPLPQIQPGHIFSSRKPAEFPPPEDSSGSADPDSEPVKRSSSSLEITHTRQIASTSGDEEDTDMTSDPEIESEIAIETESGDGGDGEEGADTGAEPGTAGPDDSPAQDLSPGEIEKKPYFPFRPN